MYNPNAKVKWIPDIGTSPTGDDVPDATNGWKNLQKYLTKDGTSPRWSDFATPGTPLGDDCYTFKTGTMEGKFEEKCIKKVYNGQFWDGKDKECYHAVYAALSRNRDLNRDGIIDEKEMLWFLPTEVQYMECVVGGSGMASPLMRASEYQPSVFNNTPRNLPPFHFVGSNNRQLWAEQSLSTGSVFIKGAEDVGNDAQDVRVGWNMRCARYIKDGISSPSEFAYQAPYEVDTEKRIITCHFDPLVLRNPTQGALIFHGNFDDQRNAPCYQFRYGKEKLTYSTPASASILIERLRNNFYCNEYNEGENDRGLWRLPNLRELAIMYLLPELRENLILTTDKIITYTYWQLYPYTTPDECQLLFKSANRDNFATISAKDWSGKTWETITVIPVRDIE